ncbi:hypothetical protein IWQ57_002584 [Coemansia nantahalensis]|uniref:Uncharacterized protein n=1 Tax=Coemansia nantahalensis TaxID=2789366 RepID=A0ACC1JZK3_9FUNG|nr:hypothetical protein IWQ57_002584 [Coemansia nantahalensis]
MQKLPWKIIDRIVGYCVGPEHQRMCVLSDASSRTNPNPYLPFLGLCREWRAATMRFVHNPAAAPPACDAAVDLDAPPSPVKPRHLVRKTPRSPLQDAPAKARFGWFRK